MGNRGMGAATRGGGAVMSRGGQSNGGRVGYKDGGSVGDSRVHPRSGSQGLAKRGYKNGGCVMDADDHPMKKGGLTAQENGPKQAKGANLTADEDGRVKKAMGGMIAPAGATAGTSSGALQNQGAIIGAKKRKKTTRLGMLKAPTIGGQPPGLPGAGSGGLPPLS